MSEFLILWTSSFCSFQCICDLAAFEGIRISDTFGSLRSLQFSVYLWFRSIWKCQNFWYFGLLVSAVSGLGCLRVPKLYRKLCMILLYISYPCNGVLQISLFIQGGFEIVRYCRMYCRYYYFLRRQYFYLQNWAVLNERFLVSAKCCK